MKLSRRFRLEKWFWVSQCPITVGTAAFFPDFWETVSIIYVAFLSIYALVLTLAGAEAAALAKEQVEQSG